MDAKLLRKNKEFDAAIDKLVDSVQSEGEQEQEPEQEGKRALVATLKLLEQHRLSELIQTADMTQQELCDINDTTLKLLGVRGEQERRQILNLIRDLMGESQVPECFRDPISFELMTDPVMLTASGPKNDYYFFTFLDY